MWINKQLIVLKKQLIDIENCLVVAKGMGYGMDKMRVGGWKVQTSSYNKSWGCNIQRGNYS